MLTDAEIISIYALLNVPYQPGRAYGIEYGTKSLDQIIKAATPAQEAELREAVVLYNSIKFDTGRLTGTDYQDEPSSQRARIASHVCTVLGVDLPSSGGRTSFSISRA